MNWALSSCEQSGDVMVGNVSTVSILHRNDFIDFGSVAVSIMEILDYLDINTCWFFCQTRVLRYSYPLLAFQVK